MTGLLKRLNPARSQVHIDQKTHASTGQTNLAPLSKTRSVCERFPDVLLLEIWKISQQFWHGASRCDRLYDYSNRNTHSSNARFATHDFWINRYSLEFLHFVNHSVPGFIASDPASSREILKKEKLGIRGGLPSTAGKLVFVGDPNSNFVALNAAPEEPSCARQRLALQLREF